MTNINEETRFYTATAEYFNEVEDKLDTITCGIFAKSAIDAETQIREDFGNHFSRIKTIEVIDHITPIF